MALVGEVNGGLRHKLATFLGVHRSSLYHASKLDQRDRQLKEQIQAVLREHKHYGYRRVAMELKIGKNRARRVMRRYGLEAAGSPHQRHYKRQKSVRSSPRNVILEDSLVARQPSHLWACDFTYLWCLGHWYYVATVIDLYTREIVGWSLSTRHDTKLILSALYDALSKQTIPMVLHFDRGSEYLSAAHLDLCDSLEIIPSASAKGSPWQNGYQERFYGSFKTELGSLKTIQSEGQLYEQIALTLNYYNTRRIHSKLKTNPRQYRQNYNENQAAKTLQKTEVKDKVSKISGA
ncbi:MAG: IS3 family transposase [Candidatus Micrarchaeaceae archaeon]